MAKNQSYSNPNTQSAGIEKKLLNDNKKSTYVNDLSQPNPLHKFASVNYIWTLSCLGEGDLTNTKTMLSGAPHDILIKSGGIGSDNNPTEEPGFISAMAGFDEKTKKLDLTTRRFRTAARVKTVFDNPRDLYFKSVELQSVPPHNKDRSFTSVTGINMEIVEPQGITFLDRLRAGAANNGYYDHLDAPYLLTLEFAGFDEKGKVPYDAAGLKNLKRVIPIKLTDCNVDLNQSGSIYRVVAIPYTEFGLSNTYLYPRTSGSVRGKTMSEACASITEILNNQNLDEKAQGLVDLPDEYSITVDDGFKNEPFNFKDIKSTGFIPQAKGPPMYGKTTNDEQIVKFSSTHSLKTILTEMCKASPEFGTKAYEKWKTKVSTELTATQIQGGNQAVYDASNEEGMFFKSYQIKTTITPLSGWENFDIKRQTHKKKIDFHITPHFIHAYSLAIPGVSTGDKFKSFVHKTYNYIFTGENVDILDLDIQYRLAYFQSRLKDVPGDSRQPVYRVTDSEGATPTGDDFVEDGSHIDKAEVTLVKGDNAGNTGEKFVYEDQLQDELSNPAADMVNVQMNILGDPAWISQSQFIPMELFTITEKNKGTASITNQDYWQGGKNYIWNDKFKCYNFDVADPIVLLNFRMPTDVDDKRGIYEMADGKATTFTGLYRVVGVSHTFDTGSFTQSLNMVRFKNQGIKINKPIRNMKLLSFKNRESYVVPADHATDIIKQVKNSMFELRSVENLFGKITNFTNNLKTRVIDKVKGKFFS